MRKFTFMLPAFAILLAATVLVSELGGSLSAQTPPAPTSDSVQNVDLVNNDDVSAATWNETALKSVDTRKPKLPPAPAKKKK
jgi:hypothetical protein